MKKLWDFIKSHKYAIIWTICYITVTWVILYFLFNFSIFNRAQWHQLAHAQLRGFPGFVFGILVLAALPLYVATTTLIIRTKKPLISIPIPKIKIPLFSATAAAPAPESDPTPETPTLGPDESDTPAELPDDMPAELRFAFIRARNNIGRIQTSAFNSPHSTIITEPTPQSEITPDTFPLPTDFDTDISYDTPYEQSDIPTFTEINFDTIEAPQPNDSTPTTNDNPNDNTELVNYLTQNAKPHTIDDNIVITDTHAIVTHSDTDFWVADTENWFAAGRICPSPIIRVQDAATKHNRTPAIYLATRNIMDIDKLIPEWESAGITVITDLSEI